MSEIKISSLQNGLTIITEKVDYVQSFSLGFWIKTGSFRETIENNGLSHFIEHMLFKGTKNRSARRIANEVESLGGYLNAFTSKENTCFYGRGLSKHFKKTFDVIADMLVNPLFKPEDIKKESSVIIDELHDIEDSPEEFIFDVFESELLKETCYEFPIIGTEKSLLNFQRKDFFDYMQKFYLPNNIIISASGDVDHAFVIELSKKYFSEFKAKNIDERDKIFLQKSTGKTLSKNIQQSHIIIGRTTFGYNFKDRMVIYLISHILGEGSSSRLFQSLREKNGITYQINSFLNSFLDVGTFGIYFSTNPELVKKALKIIRNELVKMNSGDIKSSELRKAKEFTKGSLALSLESVTNRMTKIAKSYIYFGKVKTYDDVVDEINSVNLEDVNKFAISFFDPENFTNISVVPK